METYTTTAYHLSMFIGCILSIIWLIIWLISKIVYLRLTYDADKLIRKMEIVCLILWVISVSALLIGVAVRAISNLV